VALNIIIAGGGIGGLTAALCLNHFGHRVTVLEQAEHLGDVGAGIQIRPNAMKVFDKLGLTSVILAKGFEPEALEMRLGRSGGNIFKVPLTAETLNRWGAPYVHIHRADLVDILSAALEQAAPGSIQLSQKVTGYNQTETDITARLVHGKSLTGDILIGSDGIHSAVRAQMLGPDQATFTGCVAWRATVTMDKLGELAPPATACVWVGPGRHAVTYQLRGGQLANLVAVVERSNWTSESWTQHGTCEAALEDFAGWHPIIRNMIKTADQHFQWALYDRAPLPKWTDGRAALVGDACHPMLPFAAQGAVMAIEDAWVLADQLSRAEGHPAAALQTYFKTRIKRTSKVQADARKNMKIFHKPAGIGQLATYSPMWIAGRFVPAIIRANRDKLYAHDVTAA